MNSKKKITIGLLTFIIVLIFITALSYAYFSANISGNEESTTITVTGGTMNIFYNGGPNITVSAIVPQDEPFVTKTFTITGNNSTDLEMYYEASLVVEENTFSHEAIKYKLIGTNNGNNGTLIKDVTELMNVGTGTNNLSLGVGGFATPTNGNKVHTYNLELYFPETNAIQNIDQGKIFKAHVEIKVAEKPPLGPLKDIIIAQGGGVNAIVARGTPDFSEINGTSGIYATTDDYGTSYYYRGAKYHLNNNLVWGGFQWKIVRVNGDGSVRIVYNGTEAQFNINKTVNVTGPNTQITETAWNSNNRKDVKYVGYMYGGAVGTASTQRDGNISTAATYNETESNMKTTLDNWYEINIENTGYSHMVADSLFCNDRQLASEVGGPETGPGFGSTLTEFAAYNRLESNKDPDLKCAFQNDQFTVESGVLGNGALTYSVGLLTADEASMAGLVSGIRNEYNFLYTNTYFWLFTPMRYASDAYVFHVGPTGELHYFYQFWVERPMAVRPSVSLISSAVVQSGTGSATEPFIIE